MPPRRNTLRRFYDPSIPLPTVLRHLPQLHRLYSEQQRAAIRGPLSDLSNPKVVRYTSSPFVSGRPGLGFSPPTIVQNHYPTGRSIVGRPMKHPRRGEGCLNTHALCLRDIPWHTTWGGRCIVGTGSQWSVGGICFVCRSEVSQVLLAARLCHTHPVE